MTEIKIKEIDGFKKDKNQSFFGKKQILLLILLSFFFGILGGVFASRILMPFLVSKFKKEEVPIIKEQLQTLKVQEDSAVIEAVEKVGPSVVSIFLEKDILDFFGNTTKEKSAGTGFILTSDGYILTNKHVVSQKEAIYTVITYDGKSYKGKVIAYDPFNDIAVLKIAGENLKPVEIGSTSDLKIGQRVIAIGNALGEFQNTVTIGVVSARGRAVTAGDIFSGTVILENLIQTDAAINPGNSGGPLVNLAGQVVGINTAMAEAENIGFAISIEVIKPLDNFIKNLKEKGKIVRPMIGIYYLPITKELAAIENLPVTEGAWVYSGKRGVAAVIPKGPADKAGIEEGDIIVAINNEKIQKDKSLTTIIQQYQPQNTIEVQIMRGSKEIKLKVTLEEFK